MAVKEKLNDIANAGKEKISNEVALKKKQFNEKSITLPLGDGMFSGKVKLWQQLDGTLYLDNDVDNLYRIKDFIWNGAQYEIVTKTKTKGKNKGKQKRTGRVIGATVGTILMPGVGTVIGAMHGTGNKKSKGKSKENTVTRTGQEEVGTPAILKLQNLETNEVTSIEFICTTDLAFQINNTFMDDSIINEDDVYDVDEVISETEPSENEPTLNPYDEVKQLKELLDMGIITQEEFDTKKKGLLGL